MSAKSGEGEHGDAGGGGEDEVVRFTRRARRRGCGSGRWSRKSGPGGARTKVSAGARRGRATTSASGGACVLLYWEMCSSSHVKRGKDTHCTTGPESGTRGMRGSKPAGFTGVGERAARSLDITLVQKRIGGLQNYASPGLAVLGSRRPGPPAPAQAGTRGAQIYIPKYQRTRSPRTITAQIL